MRMTGQLPYLSASDLQALDITTEEVIASIEHLIRGRKQSQSWNAPKAVLTPGDGRYMSAMLSAADDPPFMAVKSLLLNPRNSDRGLSEIQSLVTLMDSDTGQPLAVMDGNWITAIRTAGLSAVAAKRLANPSSEVVAFVGCGVQANSHLRAFADLFPLQEVRAFSRGTKTRNALCQNAKALGFRALACSSAKAAIDSADLIVTSVTLVQNIEPFIDARWLKPGSFACVTDLGIPWIELSMSLFDLIYIDDKDQEQQMPDKLVRSDLVTGDLADLVNGDGHCRKSDNEKTAFVFRGVALGDLALAGLAYGRWLSQG